MNARRGTSGAAAFARVLVQATASKPLTVVELARSEGLARSTAFDIVRRMEVADFVERLPGGKIVPGPAATALGFARFGLAGVSGPAHGLLTWLRDQTGATASLFAIGNGVKPILLARAHMPVKTHSQKISISIKGAAGHEVARISIDLSVNASLAERQHTEHVLDRARQSLERLLVGDKMGSGA
jgi:hypothetical protein